MVREPAAPTAITPATVSEVDEAALVSFVNAELELLDQRRFEDWIELFAEDGFYWAPVAANQKSPLDHVSLFYDDVRAMRLRAARLRHPRIHVQDPPSRTVHLVSNFRGFLSDGRGHVRFRCNFIVFEFRHTQGQRVYGGTYAYHLRHVEDRWRIAEKTAEVVNSEDMFPSLSIWF